LRAMEGNKEDKEQLSTIIDKIVPLIKAEME